MLPATLRNLESHMQSGCLGTDKRLYGYVLGCSFCPADLTAAFEWSGAECAVVASAFVLGINGLHLLVEYGRPSGRRQIELALRGLHFAALGVYCIVSDTECRDAFDLYLLAAAMVEETSYIYKRRI